MSDIESKSQQQKIAIVTGALGGIGTAICKKLIANDYFIIATVSKENPERIKKWCADHSFDSDDFEFITVDLTAHEQTMAVIEDTISKYDNIYALINSAGITRIVALRK